MKEFHGIVGGGGDDWTPRELFEWVESRSKSLGVGEVSGKAESRWQWDGERQSSQW